MLKSHKKDIFGLFIALAAGFLLQIAVAFALMLPAMILWQDPNDMLGLTVLVTHVVLVICFGLWYILGCCGHTNIRSTFKNNFSGKNLITVLILAVGSCYLTNFAMPIAGMFIPENVMEAYMELMETAGFGESILPTLAAVLIAPFGEEFIFRGVIYHYACNLVAGMQKKRKAFYLANIVQALAFGIFHGNLIQGTYAFLLGLVLGYLRERYHSIWAPILAHMIINTCSSFLWEPVAMLLPESLLVFVAGTAIFSLIVIIGFKVGGAAVDNEEI